MGAQRNERELKAFFLARPGCVQATRSRSTGRILGVYHARLAGMAGRGGRWVAVCEDHGEYKSAGLRSAAQAWAAAPLEWCQQCRAERGVGT